MGSSEGATRGIGRVVSSPLSFGAAAQGNVEGDDSLGTVINVHGLAELGAEQRFLSGEHFKVALSMSS